MVHVESGRANVRSAVRSLVDLMMDAGATLHTGLRIVEVDGRFSVWADGDDPWLMRVPLTSLVPIGDVTWSEEPPLRVTSIPQHFTPLQCAVLEACAAVMAAAGTWEHFRATHPRATIADPEAIEVIRSLHPAFSPASDAAAMLKTRTIKLALDGGEPTSYLMPMLDLVNHHPKAPAYPRDGDFLGISTWRATPGDECFVSYGFTRDVLGIALAYGYVDANITRANALPGDYALPGGDTLRLVRASRPESESEPDALAITGAAWDASDPSVQRLTLLQPIERHLRDRGKPAMQARHQARVLAHRIRQSDESRVRLATERLDASPGCSLVTLGLRRHLAHLERC